MTKTTEQNNKSLNSERVNKTPTRSISSTSEKKRREKENRFPKRYIPLIPFALVYFGIRALGGSGNYRKHRSYEG